MNERTLNSHTKTQKSIGDRAVDGLFAGLVAGIIMLLYLIAVGLLGGETLSQVLGRFGVRETVHPLMGGLSHLSTSAIYGLVFGLFTPSLRGRLPLWGLGLAYGLVLFVFGWIVLIPQSQSPLQGIPAAHFAVAHLIFGGALGIYLASAKP